jgi:hypothetical protein
MMQRIRTQNHIDAMAALGWHEPGIHMISGQRVLVTKGCELIKALPGAFPIINEILHNMLGSEQLRYFLGWFKMSVCGLYGGRKLYGQAVVFCGPANSGKSLVQNLIITPILGGKSARPFSWLSGETQFNSELFEAVHLLIEDEYYLGDSKSRKAFGAALKKLTANTEQKLHRKGYPAYTVKPFWRVSISLNDEPHNLAVLPELDPSLEDKIHIFLCEKHPIPIVSSGKGSEKLREAITEELPHFLHYLLHEHNIEEEISCDRYGVKAFVHAEIKENLEDIDSAGFVYEILESLYRGKRLEKKLSEILADIENSSAPRSTSRAIYSQNHLASCLRKLEKHPKYAGHVCYKRTETKRVWILNIPESGSAMSEQHAAFMLSMKGKVDETH